jgi:hypothetical protein
VRALRVVVREVDETALGIPDVLAVDRYGVANRDRHAPSDVDVVVDEQRLGRGGDLDDETLVDARWSGVVGQHSRHGSLNGYFDVRASLREEALDHSTLSAHRRAGHDDRHKQRGARDQATSAGRCHVLDLSTNRNDT